MIRYVCQHSVCAINSWRQGGNWTVRFPTAKEISVYDAAMRGIAESMLLLVIGGKETPPVPRGTGPRRGRSFSEKRSSSIVSSASIAQIRSVWAFLPFSEPPVKRVVAWFDGEETFDVVGSEADHTMELVQKSGDAAKSAMSSSPTMIAAIDSLVEADDLPNGGIFGKRSDGAEHGRAQERCSIAMSS